MEHDSKNIIYDQLRNPICIKLVNLKAHTPYLGKINKTSPKGFLNIQTHSFRHFLYNCIEEI